MRRRAVRLPYLLLAASFAAALVLCRSEFAHAQVSPEHDQLARLEFNAGREAFSRGSYEDAVRRFEHAHSLSGRPQLWYNIGTSYDRLHNWVAARNAFEHYLREVPDAMERDEVSARLNLIAQEITRDRERALHPAVVVQAPPRVIVQQVAEPTRVFRVGGLVFGGLAVITGLVGAAMAITGENLYRSSLIECPMSCTDATIRELELRETLVNLSIGAGIGFAAISITGLLIDYIRGAPAAVPMSPPVRARRTIAPVALTAPSGSVAGGMLMFSGAF